MSTTAIDIASDVTAIEEGKLLDYITNRPIPDTPKEQVRQRIARALFHEYGISVDDMEPDFKVKIDGRNKKVDIAVFEFGAEHVIDSIRRIIICEKEPNPGKKRTYKMRDYKQAEKEFSLLHAAMAESPGCRYGLWTNGLEFFFFEKTETRFDVKFKPIGDWPVGDESIGTRDVASTAQMRRADPEMLRTAFRRCHNFIHGNEGMPKDAAFWQFLYLIFAKMYDEKQSGSARQFWAGATEQFDAEGHKAIRARIEPLFKEVKQVYSTIFDEADQIKLSDRALAFMVSELAKYDFGRTDVDAKGAAYQEIVGTNLRGDRGQYFTPRGAIKLIVQMLDPKPNERVLDPACGTGGFLVATLDHINKLIHAEAQVATDNESTDEFLITRDNLSDFAANKLFGADFDPFLVRAAQMNVVMASNAEANLFNMNSLEFPAGHLSGVESAKELAPLGSMDLVMTNPPFGSDIPITDQNILRQYDLAHVWERTEGGSFRNTGRIESSVSPEILFIERCINWLRPGGRMGIVLPNGILGNPGDEYVRWWLLRHCWVLATIELPVEVFVAEADVNILTSILILKRKHEFEIQAGDLGEEQDYHVFAAVAEHVGFDRRGAIIYKRNPAGDELTEEVSETERIRIGGRFVSRTLKRRRKILDNDLPIIGRAYLAFREEEKEPGV